MQQRIIVWLSVMMLCVSGFAYSEKVPTSQRWIVEPGAPHCGVAWPFRHLIGNLHNHTVAKLNDHQLVHGYRKETEQARAVGVQVFGKSDHDGDLGPELRLAQRSYARSVSVAEPAFVALAGEEWTIGSLAPCTDNPVAHINIFGANRFVAASQSAKKLPTDLVATSLAEFYQVAPDIVRSAPQVVLQYNHAWAGRRHFDNFARPANFALLEDPVALHEVDSGLTDSLRAGLRHWQRALQEGWRVAPTANNDSEGGIDRSNRDRSTGIWVEPTALARDPQQAVLQALRARRCYVRKAKATLQFGVASGDAFVPMGSRIAVPASREVTAEFRAEADHQFDLNSASLYLVRKGTVDRQPLAFREFIGQQKVIGGQIRCLVPRDTICLYLAFRSGRQILISAPVWFDWSGHSVVETRPPSELLDRLALSVEPDGSVRLVFTSYADWHQRLVIRRDGANLRTVLIRGNGQSTTYRYTNTGDQPIRLWFEAAHRRGSQAWQATRLSLRHDDTQPPLLVFEDGDDRDYNDLIVEIYRE